MEAKSKKEKLGNLPPSDSEYFTKYEADITKTEMKKPTKCEHYFMYVKAGQIECKNCRMGLYLDVGDLLKDGHLYKNNKLII